MFEGENDNETNNNGISEGNAEGAVSADDSSEKVSSAESVGQGSSDTTVNFDALPDDLLSNIQEELPDGALSTADVSVSDGAPVDFDVLPDDLLSTIQNELPTSSGFDGNSQQINFDALPDDLLSNIQGELPEGLLSSSASEENPIVSAPVNFDVLPDDLLSDIQGELPEGATDVHFSIPSESMFSAAPKGVALDSDIDALLFADESASGAAQVDTNDLDALLSGDATSHLSISAKRGMDAILKKTMIYYERLPMLEVVFDRLIRLLSTNLRNFTSDNVEIRMDSTKSMRFGDYLNSIPLPAMLGVFKAKEWDNQGLIVVDSTLIYSIVDVLLGGRNSSSGTLAGDGRTFTTIECNLIEKLIGVFLEDLGAAFEPICGVEFIFERLELNPSFAMISRASNAGILVKLGVEIDDRYGKITLFLPYATIEPIRELLLQNFMGEKFGRDSIWEEHLIAELKETEITFDIHLITEMMRLSSVLGWKVGDSIYFSTTPQTLVTAKSGEHALFQGVVGHKNGKVAVKIKDNLLERTMYVEGEPK